jgi:NRPS condensation-like uncharacterized protein
MTTGYPADLVDLHQILQLNVNHQEIHLVISFEGELDAARLSRAVRLICDREPILGCRLIEKWYRPYWLRRTDLDDLDHCPVVETTEPEVALQQFMVTPGDPRNDPLLRVRLFRGRGDTLCIKLSHLSGDAVALFKVARLLGEYYTRLKLESGFVPEVNRASRAFAEVAREFTWQDCRRILRKMRANRSVMKSLWKLSPEDYSPQRDQAEAHYVVRKIAADAVSRMAEYARRTSKAAATVALMAAYYCAMRQLFDVRDRDEETLVLTTVDVRRYLPKEKRVDPAVSNMSGPVRLRVPYVTNPEFGAVLGELNEQFKLSHREGLQGVDNPLLLLSRPPASWLLPLIPFGLLRRRSMRFVEQNASTPYRSGGVANFGELQREDYAFDDLPIRDMWGAGALFRHFGIGVVACKFEGALTLCLGFHSSLLHREKGEQLLDLMARQFEALPG